MAGRGGLTVKVEAAAANRGLVLACVYLVHAEREGHIVYKKVLLAYDGSIEGRRALREGAKIAQFCGAEVFLLGACPNSRC
jgi:hypothetical protein